MDPVVGAGKGAHGIQDVFIRTGQIERFPPQVRCARCAVDRHLRVFIIAAVAHFGCVYVVEYAHAKAGVIKAV